MEIVAGGEGGGEEGRVQLSSGKKGRKETVSQQLSFFFQKNKDIFMVAVILFIEQNL